MKGFKQKMNLLSVLCLLLSIMLIASSCVAANPNGTETGDNKTEENTKESVENTTTGGGNEDEPATDPNKIQFSIAIKDTEGFGWEGVRVQICEKGDSGKCSMPGTTDENGNVAITVDKTLMNINNSVVKIIKATGYVTTKTQFEIIPGDTSMKIELAEYTVKADNFGNGVENVEVTVSREDAVVATGKTAASGEVKFLLENDDDYIVTVKSPEGATLVDSAKTSWAFEESYLLNISYIVIVTVDKTVTVVDANNAPVSGASVFLISTSQEKDENGNYIAAHSGTTGSDGKVTFPGLNQSSRYYVVINGVAVTNGDGEKIWLDMGMTELTVTYSNTQAADVTYTVKVGYNDADNKFVVLQGAYTVIVVRYDDNLNEIEIGRYTTVNGEVQFTLPEGSYAVKIDEASIPEGYVATTVEGFFDKIAELKLAEKVESVAGDSAENPLLWNTTHPMTGMPIETTQTLTGFTLEQQIWYQLSLSVGMELYIETSTAGAFVAVDYNGRTFTTEDGKLTLAFEEPSPMMQQALIRVYLVGRVYSADVTLIVREAGSAGGGADKNPDNLAGAGVDNDPFIITTGGSYTAVVTSTNGWASTVVYQITIAADGTLKVSSTDTNHFISLICQAKNIYSEPTDPAQGVNEISYDVKAGDVWIIIVSTADSAADEIVFNVTVS